MNGGFDTMLASARIRRLGIRPRARISALSGGERAQVALTLVLAKRPELFLLDEPMANLDPLARREFLGSMFEACTETGATVLYSSHAVAELERVCDYLIVLRAGLVRIAGDIDELREQHRIISGPDGWSGGGWQVISQRSTAGRTIALVRRDNAARVAGPGLQEEAPTFDELVLGYLDGDAAALPQEALA
jgi:ABC-2 type transport system ATP-binding protein